MKRVILFSTILAILFISCSKDEVSQFNMLAVNYQALIGSLNYLSVLNWPDISYSVSKLLQFLEQPGINHYYSAVQVFQYLHQTKTWGLFFCKNHSSPLVIAVDADWGNCPITRSSVTSFVSMTRDHLMLWKSGKQDTVLLSSAEANTRRSWILVKKWCG